jgi:hypothetical protein
MQWWDMVGQKGGVVLEIYELIYSIFKSSDLLYGGQLLIEFANASYKEKNRATPIEHFYEYLYQWRMSNHLFNNLFEEEKSNYFICDEAKAVGTYIALRIPAKKTPVKSINEIRAFGEYILSHYTQPVGKCISESSLKDILQYLDKHLSFSSKIFANNKAAFIRMPYSHKEYNSECLSYLNRKGSSSHFFLYHMTEKGGDAPNPEAVLFHELGHAIHARYFDDVNRIPDKVLEKLQKIGLPNLKQANADEQREVFADVLSVGLMYQTPYEKYDLYKKIHPDGKMAFKELVETLLKNIAI